MEEVFKKCSSCEEVKPVGDFYKDNRTYDKLCCRCKDCDKAKSKEYRTENQEKEKERKKRDRALNLDVYQKREADWKKNNSEKFKNYYRKWRENNSEKIKEYIKSWHSKNPTKRVIYSEARRAKKTENGGRISREEWENLVEKYNHRCLCCGRTDVKLTMDHVIPLSRGGSHTIDNIQPLCKSCNCSKKSNSTDYRK
jgi:5-methylcytosine-specific restriction endonuclease McrA